MSAIEKYMASMQSGNVDLIYRNSGGCTPQEQFIRVLAQRKARRAKEDPAVAAAKGACFRLRIAMTFDKTSKLTGRDCYREIQVPASISLGKFHDQVLTPVLGWARCYHGYVFEDPKDGAAFGQSFTEITDNLLEGTGGVLRPP